MHETFDEIREDIRKRLLDAVENRRSPMHTPVVATAGADARIMVLRAFDPARWRLRFHTDVRSPKVDAVRADPDVAVLFYDREEKVQIRARGRAEVEHHGKTADAAWAQSTNFARRCYLGEGPGAESQGPTSGLPSVVEGTEPSEAELAPARENFAVLLIELHEMDWFYLANTGHRRAILTQEEGRWVTP